jgi:aminoglycoside 3-N-acetyltransferase
MPASAPAGAAALAEGLRALGLRRGQDLLIHCSLREIGPVQGGPAALLTAVDTVAGPQSTLVVPTETPLSSRTSAAFLAATAGMTSAETDQFAAAIPAFNAATSPSQGMGAFAEFLRTRPEARRSGHPLTSFAALGPRAADCVAVHDLDCHLGERSPLGWLYRADAAILLLGVGYSVCTAFHLAEYRPGIQRDRAYQCRGPGSGRELMTFTARDLTDSDFGQLGGCIEHEPFVEHGRVGRAHAILLPFRSAVDFAHRWFLANRRPTSADDTGSDLSRHSCQPIS